MVLRDGYFYFNIATAFEEDNELAMWVSAFSCTGRRKLGNSEKSSAGFEHGINFGFNYSVIPEVWEGEREFVRVWFLRQALESLYKI